MSRRKFHRHQSRHVAQRNSLVRAAGRRVGNPLSKRGRRMIVHQDPFSPPENWYDSATAAKPQGDYRIVVQDPGEGFRHVVTPQEIRDRLSRLPAAMVAPLEVVQLSQLTRKKQSYPCYGMQWGKAIY